MKTIKIINETSLRSTLKEQFRIAFQFQWTGWRIPIYLEDDGSVTSGGWLSNNSYQPDAFELPIKVETWDIDDDNIDSCPDDEREDWINETISEYLDEEIAVMMQNLQDSANDIFWRGGKEVNYILTDEKYLITKSGLVKTTTNQFSDTYTYLFLIECQLAYNVLEEAGVEMKMENEAWTDIMLDNSDPLNRKFYAVYGEGAVTSNSDCIYIEVEPDESILERVISILPE